MQEKRKYTHRAAPCPSYDVEGLESWLSDLSREGLLLEKDGIFCGIFTFCRTAPQQAKYRLEAVKKRSGPFSDGDEVPSQEVQELSETYGWEYLATYGEFQVYRTLDPQARELNTDPQVHALALKAVRKRQRWNLIWALIEIAFLVGFSLRRIFFLEALALGSPVMLLFLMMVVWSLLGSFRTLLHLNRLCQKLKNTGTIDHEKDWKKAALPFRAARIFYLLMLALLMVLLCRSCANTANDAGEISLGDYSGDPPFVTMADLAPEGQYTAENSAYSNTVRQWSDWIAPVNIHWLEQAQVKTAAGTVSGPLAVYYHETVHPWIARQLAQEYLEKLNGSKYFQWMELPELDADYAVAFSPSPTVILQKGNVVVVGTVYCHLSPEGGSLYQEWAIAMAQMLAE